MHRHLFSAARRDQLGRSTGLHWDENRGKIGADSRGLGSGSYNCMIASRMGEQPHSARASSVAIHLTMGSSMRSLAAPRPLLLLCAISQNPPDYHVEKWAITELGALTPAFTIFRRAVPLRGAWRYPPLTTTLALDRKAPRSPRGAFSFVDEGDSEIAARLSNWIPSCGERLGERPGSGSTWCWQALHHTMGRTRAAAALPSVIGGPGWDLIMGAWSVKR